MSSKQNKHKAMSLSRVALAAIGGMGLTLLLTIVCSLLILNGYWDVERSDMLLLVSIFMGALLSGRIIGHSSLGAIPQVLLSCISYLFLLLLIAALREQRMPESSFLFYISVSALLGSTSGIVTKLVKSNKSYINKSKRKHMIT